MRDLNDAVQALRDAAKPSKSVDPLRRAIGKRADDFKKALGDDGLYGKVANGAKLTPDELNRASKAWNDSKGGQKSGTPQGGQTLQDVRAQAAKLASEDAKAAKAAKLAARTPKDVFRDKVRHDLGIPASEKFFATADQGVLKKLFNDPDSLTREEERKLFNDYRDAQRPKATPAQAQGAVKALQDIRKDSELQREREQTQYNALPAKDKVLAAAKKLIDPDNPDALAEFSKKLAKLDPNDHEGMAKLLASQKRTPILDTLVAIWKAGLLNGPPTFQKIGGAHGGHIAFNELAKIPTAFWDEAISRIPGKGSGLRTQASASLTDMRSAARIAAKQGVEEAKVNWKAGPAAMRLMNPKVASGETLGNLSEINSGNKLVDTYVNKTFRAHSSLYHIMKTYSYQRAIEAQARVQAMNEAKLGGHDAAWRDARQADLASHPTPEMHQNALDAMETETFTNPNKISKGINAVRDVGPGARRFVDFTVPFSKVPVNVGLRLADNVTGLPVGLAQLAKALFTEGKIPLEQQRMISDKLGKGTAGAGIVLLGYQLYRHGLYRPPNPQKGEPGSIYLGGRWHQLGKYQEVGGMFNVGATLGQLADEKGVNDSDYWDALRRNFGEMPLLDTPLISTIQSPTERNIKGLEANYAGSAVPGIVAYMAEVMDPKARYQSVKEPGQRGFVPSPAAHVQNRIPFAREKLEPSPYPNPYFVGNVAGQPGKPMTIADKRAQIEAIRKQIAQMH